MMIGSMTLDEWAQRKGGSVPDSLRANVEMMKHARETLGQADPVAAVMQFERTRGAGRASNWTPLDYERMKSEYVFSWNWWKAGSPVFALTHSMAALLTMTRAPAVDFEHAPYQAFLISVPDEFLPMVSNVPRSTRWVGVQRLEVVAEHDSADRLPAGYLLAIPDSEMLSDGVAVGLNGRLTEDGIASLGGDVALRLSRAVRLAANVIQYVSQHRASGCVRRTSSVNSTPCFEVRPPADVVVDRAFRDLASDLARSRDFKGARRALSHIVRGHWRNQPVGSGRSDRRLTWIHPFRRGDESLGAVVQRTMRIYGGKVSDDGQAPGTPGHNPGHSPPGAGS